MHIYRFSPTRIGFYTAVFDAFTDRTAILCCSPRQIELGDTEIYVLPDKTKARRVKQKLAEYDDECLHDVDYILRSDGKDKENVAFRYIRRICEEKGPVRDHFADPDAFLAYDYIHRVSWELDKMYGLLRFSETAGGILYAPYEPTNDLTGLIVWHFIGRLQGEKFVIHDVNREIAAVYNGKDCLITNFSNPEICFSDEQNYFEGLWRTYYRSVNIASRPHEKQMRASMPVRYWKYLPEKKPY